MELAVVGLGHQAPLQPAPAGDVPKPCERCRGDGNGDGPVVPLAVRQKRCKTPKLPRSLVAQSCGHGSVQLRPAPAPGPAQHRSQERIEQISVFLLNHDL